MTDHPQPADPHPWADLTAAQALNLVLHEIYGPVSALGDQLSRLADDTVDADERAELMQHMCARVDDLSRLIILLKRYLDDPPQATPDH